MEPALSEYRCSTAAERGAPGAAAGSRQYDATRSLARFWSQTTSSSTA
jgi:hypothetical protein